MDSATVRTIVFAAGALVVVAFLRSMFRVALMNRHTHDLIAQATWRVVFRALSFRIAAASDYALRQKRLFLIFPGYVLGLIVVYFVGEMTGFALMYYATDAVADWQRAFIASGSALNTLGFATPTALAGQWLAIPEGAIGLGIIVFLFTFIPGYQSTVLSREGQTAWLYARAGAAPTGVALLEWCARAGQTGDLASIYESWEAWFRLLDDTHTVTPMLAFAPSAQKGQSWVVAANALLDAAALTMTVNAGSNPEAARLCLRAGVHAVVGIASALEHPLDAATTSGAAELARLRFDEACVRLAASGVTIAQDRDAAWQAFAALRAGYMPALTYIGAQTFAPQLDVAPTP